MCGASPVSVAGDVDGKSYSTFIENSPSAYAPRMSTPFDLRISARSIGARCSFDHHEGHRRVTRGIAGVRYSRNDVLAVALGSRSAQPSNRLSSMSCCFQGEQRRC